MELTAYQILTPAASLVAVLYAWSLVARKKKTIWEAMVWTIFWFSIAAIALFPDLLDFLRRITGVRNRQNAVFVTSIGILFFIVFYLVVRLEELERRMAKLVRSIAVRDMRDDDQ
jgi:hypothetical protein